MSRKERIYDHIDQGVIAIPGEELDLTNPLIQQLPVKLVADFDHDGNPLFSRIYVSCQHILIDPNGEPWVMLHKPQKPNSDRGNWALSTYTVESDQSSKAVCEAFSKLNPEISCLGTPHKALPKLESLEQTILTTARTSPVLSDTISSTIKQSIPLGINTKSGNHSRKRKNTPLGKQTAVDQGTEIICRKNLLCLPLIHYIAATAETQTQRQKVVFLTVSAITRVPHDDLIKIALDPFITVVNFKELTEGAKRMPNPSHIFKPYVNLTFSKPKNPHIPLDQPWKKNPPLHPHLSDKPIESLTIKTAGTQALVAFVKSGIKLPDPLTKKSSIIIQSPNTFPESVLKSADYFREKGPKQTLAPNITADQINQFVGPLFQAAQVKREATQIHSTLIMMLLYFANSLQPQGQQYNEKQLPQCITVGISMFRPVLLFRFSLNQGDTSMLEKIFAVINDRFSATKGSIISFLVETKGPPKFDPVKKDVVGMASREATFQLFLRNFTAASELLRAMIAYFKNNVKARETIQAFARSRTTNPTKANANDSAKKRRRAAAPPETNPPAAAAAAASTKHSGLPATHDPHANAAETAAAASGILSNLDWLLGALGDPAAHDPYAVGAAGVATGHNLTPTTLTTPGGLPTTHNPYADAAVHGLPHGLGLLAPSAAGGLSVTHQPYADSDLMFAAMMVTATTTAGHPNPPPTTNPSSIPAALFYQHAVSQPPTPGQQLPTTSAQPAQPPGPGCSYLGWP